MGTPELGGTDGYSETCIERKIPAMDAAAENAAASTGKGLVFQRFFTDGKKSPFDAVEWEKRTALIGNEKA